MKYSCLLSALIFFFVFTGHAQQTKAINTGKPNILFLRQLAHDAKIIVAEAPMDLSPAQKQAIRVYRKAVAATGWNKQQLINFYISLGDLALNDTLVKTNSRSSNSDVQKTGTVKEKKENLKSTLAEITENINKDKRKAAEKNVKAVNDFLKELAPDKFSFLNEIRANHVLFVL